MHRIEKSNVAEHSFKEQHSIDWNNAKIIKNCSDDFTRKLYETIAIRTSDESQLMNKNKTEYLSYTWNRLLRPLKK